MAVRRVGRILLFLGLLVNIAYAQETDSTRMRSRSYSSRFDPRFLEYRIDQRIERDLKRYTSTYDLSEEQAKIVRERLEKLKYEALEYIESVREEREILAGEMHDLWEKRRNGEQVDENRMNEIRRQLGQLFRNTPLLNPMHVVEEIEKLLPEDQVMKGRQRKEMEILKLEKRRDEANWLAQLKNNTRHISGRRDWWDRYVERFIHKYKLDPSQQAAAQSILRILKQERDNYRESKREDYLAAYNLEDRKERSQKIKELNKPVDRYFDDLKFQLERIPTAAQKLAAEPSYQRTTQTRPAYASTQPADMTVTRPAEEMDAVTEEEAEQTPETESLESVEEETITAPDF